ncbi:MAG: Asp23/Gls24 family envelope stress response protein [Clostridia bacterium]|nr:Asp23/Gls24 family envelope stress response protein [Clostridia bacterium]MBQ2517927.1 Asp23/Gls24 family envelope stress response protein [Clostridia bacterium]MBQ4342247.1 Asp23/Gls24 family envelope stress response protein [Clostridia bacterium]MBR6428971.1 Asp23/Gls24 family envelope stress response protein [Clostridia bacterium]
MDHDTEVVTDISVTENGKVVFAPDVVATIAGLAASEVKGVSGLAGTVIEGISGIFTKNNMTKGVHVEVGREEAAVDISINVKYGSRIQDVCSEVQNAVKSAIETMTSLKVVEVNVLVQNVTFDEPEKPEKKKDRPEIEARVR